MKNLQLDVISREGKAYISRKSLATLLNVERTQIINYEKTQRYKKPLVQSFKEGRVVYYDLLYAINWYNSNVNLKSSPKKEKSYVAESMANIDSVEITDDEKMAYQEFISSLDKEMAYIFKSSSLDLVDARLKRCEVKA